MPISATSPCIRPVVGEEEQLELEALRPSVFCGIDWAEDEVRRRFDFALLTEHENSEGRIYLRATNEAINVLVGGLNTDIESAEAEFSEAIRLNEAAVVARHARGIRHRGPRSR